MSFGFDSKEIGERFAALEARVDALEEQFAKAKPAINHNQWLAEYERQARWHATYNAALQGMLANPESWEVEYEDLGLWAEEHATLIHGPLEKPDAK